jgi:cell division protein FtsN
MNNYLLQLLKDVKTIIIPGLGAITLTNETTGEMMFMNYLKFDDGTLARHIAEKEGIEENDAKNRVAKFVREVQAELDKGHSYDMYQFGSFRKEGSEVVFEQWVPGQANSTTAPPAEIAQEQQPAQIGSISEEPEAGIVEPEIIREPEAEKEPQTFDAETTLEGSAIAAAVITEEAKTEEPEIGLTKEGFDTQHAPAIEPEMPKQEEHLPFEPINDVPDEVKAEPNVPPSPKDILIAQDARKERKELEKVKDPQRTKAGNKEAEPKKKTSVLSYILWGIIVLFLGGATYVAVNFSELKKSYPILADLSGDNKTKATRTEPVVAADDSAAAVAEEAQQPAEDVPPPPPAPEPQPEPVPAPPPAPKPAPKPVNSAPRVPSVKPKPSSSSSSVSIAKPDPARPFHVIGGSFSSEENAKRFARRLMAEGLPSVIVGESGGMYRVSLSSYATKADAVAAHSNMVTEFPGAWVYKWP